MPGLEARGLDSATGKDVDAPGGTNRGFFTAFPKSRLGAPERRILPVATHNTLYREDRQ